jgi:transglutaminase-like putative cysteine protease
MKKLIISIMLIASVLSVNAYALEVIEDTEQIKILSDGLCKGAKTDQEKVEKLVHAVYARVKPDSTKGISSGTIMATMDRWACGVGWCNHQVRALMWLLNAQGIHSRMLYLLNRAGTSSQHTIGEAYVGGRWVILDPTLDMTAKNKQGELISRYDAIKDPSLISNYPTQKKRLKECYGGNKEDFNEWVELYTNPAILEIEL